MEKKQLPPDFKDFFEILNRIQVRYLVAGGWALVYEIRVIGGSETHL